MAPYMPDGSFKAGRRSKYRCHKCDRHFEQGFVPVPDHTGHRICRECLVQIYGAPGR